MPSSKKIAKLIKKIELCIKQEDYRNLRTFVEKLKQFGAQNELLDVGYTDEVGKPVKCTLLMHFATLGDYESVKFLLIVPNEADVTVRNERGESALYLAVAFACQNPGYDLRIIDELLRHNPQSQLISQNKSGCTPLAFCVGQKRLDLVQTLLQAASGDPRQLMLEFGEDIGKKTIPLFEAAEKNLLLIANELLKYIPEEQIFRRNWAGSIPLFGALNQGHWEMAQTLLQFFPKTQLDVPITQGSISPLMCACQRWAGFHQDGTKYAGFLNIIQFILQHTNGAHVCIPDSLGFIPLSIACQNNFVELANLLLAYKTEEQLDFVEPEGFTPILSACYYGRIDVLQCLLKHVTPATAFKHLLRQEKNNLQNPLQIAVANPGKYDRYPTTEIIKILLQHIPQQQLMVQDDIGRTALFLAVLRGRLAAVEILISYACQEQFLISAQGGETPIYRSIVCAAEIKQVDASQSSQWKDNLKIFQLLLQHGSLEQFRIPYDGWLPIHKACELGYIQYVLPLLDKDLQQLKMVNKDGWYPLHIAVYYGQTFLVTQLLSRYHADSMQENQYGVIPLHMAFRCKDSKIIEGLLDRENSEQQLRKQTIMGSTALHFAADSNNDVAIQILLKKSLDKQSLLLIQDAAGFNPLHYACFFRESLSAVKAFVDGGADIEAVGNAGWRALHIACLRGNLEIADYLLEKGAQISVFNERGYTPLHIAAEQNNVELVRIIAKKAKVLDVNVALPGKLSPLCRAVIFGCYDVASVLVKECGADVNWGRAVKKCVVTPLRIATERACDIKMFRLLLSLGADPLQPLEDEKTVLSIVNSFDDPELKELFLAALEDDSKRRKAIQVRNIIQPPKQKQILASPPTPITDAPAAIYPTFFSPGVDRGQSGRSYIKEKGADDIRLKQFDIERREKKQIKLVNERREHKISLSGAADSGQSRAAAISWFQGKLSLQSDVVLPIRNPAGVNASCYFPQQCLAKQGYDKSADLSRRHLKFSPKSVKKLDDRESYTDSIQFPNREEKKVTYTHEFKINGLDRILLFELPADNGGACLYVGSRFVPAGLHTNEEIKSVSQSGKLKREAFIVDLPPPDEGLQAAVPATTTDHKQVPSAPQSVQGAEAATTSEFKSAL